MELKYVNRGCCFYARILLIVPYGIEMEIGIIIKDIRTRLLIVPYGIEI